MGEVARLARRAMDIVAPVAYLALGILATWNLWPGGRILAPVGGKDSMQFQWMLAAAARYVSSGGHLFVSQLLNVPRGVNMMGNTSVLGLGLPLAPVTMAFGPSATWRLLLVIGLAGTAWAWYYVLSRYIVSSKVGAAVGGAFCGFAPGMISHAAGSHINLISQFLIPFIVLVMLRLGRPERVVWRDGLLLGLLVTAQFFISEEILFYAALTCGLVVLAYAATHRRDALARAPRALATVGIGLGVGLVLLAYPLWIQFAGPDSYHGLPPYHTPFLSDLASFPAFSTESVAGSAQSGAALARNPTEETTFYGWPLLILLPILVVVAWRSWAVRIAAMVGTFFFLITLGDPIMINKQSTGIRGPWALVQGLPGFDMTFAARCALALIPLIGVVLAVGIERLSQLRLPTAQAVATRSVAAVAVIAALVPIAPTPMAAMAAPVVPRFIADGAWLRMLPAGDTIMTVPDTSDRPYGMYWSASTDDGFAEPGGYFIGPGPLGAQYGSLPRPTTTLLRRVDRIQRVPTLTDAERRAAIDDLRYWHVGLIVLGEDRDSQLYHQLLAQLYGHASLIDGSWVWDVHDLALKREVPTPGPMPILGNAPTAPHTQSNGHATS